MSLLQVLIMLLLAAIFYCRARIHLNKSYDLDLPILPERYYDNPGLTAIMAALTVGSILFGYFVVKIFTQ